MPRRLINVIGSAVVGAIALVGVWLMVELSADSHQIGIEIKDLTDANQLSSARLVELSHQEVMLPWLRHDVEVLRMQITEADELRDASDLASSAAKSSGARVVAIAFAERQVFAKPTGMGMGDDGTPMAPQATSEPNTPQVQLPVRFEVEVSSTAQAAAFIDGLRGGPRLLQVVQAQASATNDTKLFTLTVDALIFAAKD